MFDIKIEVVNNQDSFKSLCFIVKDNKNKRYIYSHIVKDEDLRDEILLNKSICEALGLILGEYFIINEIDKSDEENL